MDPVHFGIIMVVNLGIGFVTPPFGSNLFIDGVAAEDKTSIEREALRLGPLTIREETRIQLRFR